MEDGGSIRGHPIPVADRHFLFQLRSPEDKLKILAGGPWVIGGQLLLLDEWRQHFRLSGNAFQFALVWMRMSVFPVSCWSRRSVLSVPGSVGNLRMDSYTFERIKHTFARICVLASTIWNFCGRARRVAILVVCKRMYLSSAILVGG